ncbi:MAG: SDR family oxidoreductase [Pirellulales bacterium]|nr:SDR family oxidoreductase [Pirellulales bacterium]
MQIDLSGKRALVTGAARGIGRGCALELARLGADVAVNDRAASDDARAVVAEIESLGRRACLVPGDVFARASCEQVVAKAERVLDQIDILVSNPALSRRADFLDCDPTTFEQVIQGTLTGGFHMSQLVARQMVARGTRGKIVFIASVHAEVSYVRSAAYNAAKTGLVALAKTIAAELLPHRINVNVVAPGWIDTPGEHETFGGEAIAAAAPTLPWGRLGTPADIGQAVAFLASDAADYITGSTLVVDGGFLLQAAIPRSIPPVSTPS